jgi:bacterioferritin
MTSTLTHFTRESFLATLAEDLKNEYTHMHFYLFYASHVTGLHREEYRELFLKEAASEMGHVTEFSDFILGLGGEARPERNVFPVHLSKPGEILKAALAMEEEVVTNYAARIRQVQDIPDMTEAEKQWAEIFFEDQIEHSRKDVDNFKMIIKGLCHS